MTQYDTREIIARLADASEMTSSRPTTRSTLVNGLRPHRGAPRGDLANNGNPLLGDGAEATHFIELACQRRSRCCSCQNITGFMVGKAAEAGGIARDGAKMVTASPARRCRDHRHHRRSYGPATTPCRAAYSPASSSPGPTPHLRDGGPQAAGVLARPAREHRSRGQDLERAEEAAFRSRCWRTSSARAPVLRHRAVVDDGIIAPGETRRWGATLSAALNAPSRYAVRGCSDVTAQASGGCHETGRRMLLRGGALRRGGRAALKRSATAAMPIYQRRRAICYPQPPAAFKYTKGTPKTFARSDLEKPVTRKICAECGTHLVTRPQRAGRRRKGRHAR